MPLVPTDLRLAARQLSRRPGLSLALALTLAGGVAVATLAFAVVNAAFLRPPDVPDPDRLVSIYTTRADGSGHNALSYPDFGDLRAATGGVFSDVAGYSGLMATWSADGRAETLFGEIVTGRYFDMLGVVPAAGRLLTADDDRIPGQHPVVVLGHAFWRDRMGANPAAVGSTMVLNGRPYTIVGVAPPSFTGSLFRGFAVDVWAPTMMMGQLRTDQLANREERWLFVRARLAPGESLERARAATAVVATRLARDYPASNGGRQFRAVATSSVWLSPDSDGPLMLLSSLLIGGCLLVLAVGTSNVLGLLAARMVGRARDLAVHVALGATHGRLFRQLFSESVLIAGAGGAIGLALTAAAARALSTYRPPLPLPLAFDVRVDWRVTGFAMMLTVAVAAIMAAAGIRLLRRRERLGGLRQSFDAAATGRSRRHWLLVPQVAGSVVLLVLAILSIRSVTSASAMAPGFDVDNVGMLTFSPGTSGLDDARARRFFEDVAARAEATPGVTSVAVADRIPLDLYGNRSLDVAVEGRDARGYQAASITPRYFETLGIPIHAGRVFSDGDLIEPAAAAVVNDAFAAAHWPGEGALGRSIVAGGQPVTIVGVVGDVKVRSLGEPPTPMVYLPLSSGYAGLLRVVVRTEGNAAAPLELVGRRAQAAHPTVALVERRTMAEGVGVMLLPFEIGSMLGLALGAAAMALAAVGLHGIVAFAVAARTREFGLRLALGATGRQIVGAATSEVRRATAAGLAIGVAIAAIGSQLLSGFMMGVSSFDAMAFAGGVALTIAVAAIAAAAPARRATRIDPIAALRE